MKINSSLSVLRSWKSEDKCSLVRYANNPRISAMMRDGFPYPYTEMDAESFLNMAIDHGNGLFLAIDFNGEAIGGIGIHPLPDVRRGCAEIGYWIAEPFWGRGIVTDAVKAIIPIAFAEYPIIRLEAGIFSINNSSMRVLEKSGFTLESVHKRAILKRGQILDEYLYVLFREEVIDRK